MRVLIIKTSSMGDVVHALPAISDMARAIPGIQIDWLVEKSFAAMPQQHRAVQRVITLQWRKWRKSLRTPETQAAIRGWRAEMSQHRYDLIIDLQGLLKSAAFACFAQGPRAGYDWHSIREPLASLFYSRKGHVARNLHAVDRCRQLVAQVLSYPLPTTPPAMAAAIQEIQRFMIRRGWRGRKKGWGAWHRAARRSARSTPTSWRA